MTSEQRTLVRIKIHDGQELLGADDAATTRQGPVALPPDESTELP